MSVTNDRTAARLFFALWPDEAVRSRLAAVAREFRKTVAGKWVQPGNLHVTLAFLGDVEAERWPELGRIAADIVEPGFTLVLDRFEFWPRNGIVCLAPSQTPQALKALAAGLAQRLGEVRFATESRPYRAHLTLARHGRSDRTSVLLPEPITWNIDSFSLVESRLSREGTAYSRRAIWPLQDTDRQTLG